MSFSTLAFGEKCRGHPTPKPRGVDNRGMAMGKSGKGGTAASDAARATGDWANWEHVPLAGATDEPLRTLGGPILPDPTPTAPAVKPFVGVRDPQLKLLKPGHRDPVPAAGASKSILPSTLPPVPAPTATPLVVPPATRPNTALKAALPMQEIPELPGDSPVVQSCGGPGATSLVALKRHKLKEEEAGNGDGASSWSVVDDSRIDDIILKVRTFVLVRANYDESAARKILSGLLQRFTTKDDVSVENIEETMKFANIKLNPSEGDALFDRFDVEERGRLSFNDFAKGILDSQQRNVPAQSRASDAFAPVRVMRNLMVDVRRRLFARSGHLGLASLRLYFAEFASSSNNGGGGGGGKTETGLTMTALFNLVQKSGLRLTVEEMRTLFTALDRDNSGVITQTEFLRGFRSNMSRRRREIVRRVYDEVLDVNKDGLVTVDDVVSRFDALAALSSSGTTAGAGATSSRPPTSAAPPAGGSSTAPVLAPPSSAQAIFDHLRKYFTTTSTPANSSNAMNVISFPQFLSYYKDVSSGIDSDDYFVLMVKNAWHVSDSTSTPGGGGLLENTTCKRVLVTFKGGEQRIVEIRNDLGINLRDVATMKKKVSLQEQVPLDSIVEVALFG